MFSYLICSLLCMMDGRLVMTINIKENGSVCVCVAGNSHAMCVSISAYMCNGGTVRVWPADADRPRYSLVTWS